MHMAIRTSSQMVIERMLEDDSDQASSLRKPNIDNRYLNTIQSQSMNDDTMSVARKYCYDNNLSPTMIRQVVRQLRSVNKDENSVANQQQLMNRGAMLYERNVRIHEQNKKRLREKAQQMRQKEYNVLSFQPEINPVSELIVQKMRRNRPETLNQSKILSNTRMASLRKLKEVEEMAECSFHPTINQSRTRKTSIYTTKFDELYESGLKKKLSQQVNVDIHGSKSFHPQINELSQMIVNGMTFNERMKKYESDKMAKYQQQQLKKQQTESQERLPKSKISRRSDQKSSSMNYLSKTRNQKTQISSPTKQTKLEANIRSKEIYQMRKLKALKHIFYMMDSDQDGVICSTKINITDLQKNVLRIIAPVLAEMEEVGVQLNELEFIEAMGKLFNGLLPQDKHAILIIDRQQQKGQELAARPSLNQRSLLLAEKIRTVSIPGVSLYDYCKVRQQQRKRWLEEQRLLTQARLMRDCSFLPKTHTLQ